MLGVVKFLQKRPSDLQIRVFRVILGLLIMIPAYFSLIQGTTQIETDILWMNLVGGEITLVKYLIVFLGFIPFIIGLTNVCLMKSKYMRYVQVVFAILLFYSSSIIIEGATLGIDTLLFILAFFPLLAGITGKCITKDCLRYGQKITKIRV